MPAASGQTTLLSARLAANPARLAGSAGLARVCTHAISFPSSAWPGSHRLRRPAPTGATMATFRPIATFHNLGGYVAKGPNLSISNRCDFDRFFRVTTCQQPRRLLHVSSRRRRHRPASEHVLPAAKRHFARRVWPQTQRGSLAPLGSYVYAHMHFLSPHLPGLLPIVCDGQHRPVRRWPPFGRKRPFPIWGGYVATGPNLRFRNDATMTDSFALRRASSRGDSCTSPIVVVVGRLASTGCQRPNDTSLGASGRKPSAARLLRWARRARLLRWARRARTCMHTCIFFPLICLACSPSSATASTDRCGDGHRSAESDLSQSGGGGGGGGGTLRRVQISRFQTMRL